MRGGAIFAVCDSCADVVFDNPSVTIYGSSRTRIRKS